MRIVISQYSPARQFWQPAEPTARFGCERHLRRPALLGRISIIVVRQGPSQIIVRQRVSRIIVGACQLIVRQVRPNPSTWSKPPMVRKISPLIWDTPCERGCSPDLGNRPWERGVSPAIRVAAQRSPKTHPNLNRPVRGCSRVGSKRVAFRRFSYCPPPNRACDFHRTRLSRMSFQLSSG